MSLLCKIGLHDWVVNERAYSKDELGQYQCGEVKLCVECGKISRKGKAFIPEYVERWSREIKAKVN